jgi:hypothetical protein
MRRADMNDDELIWQETPTAPFNRDLELAVIEGDHVYTVVFPCRRTVSGWIRATSMERIAVNPTHWRPWPQSG